MLKTLLGVSRINFLTLTLACVLLALAFSLSQGAAWQWLDLVLVLMIALPAHISVNAFNEYFDFRSGLDFLTTKTPFSGGSGTLVTHPQQARLALFLAWGCLGIVMVAGLILISRYGWPLLWIGLPGVLIICTYTQYINRSPLVCLVAPGIGFGMLMTLGSIWVLQQSLPAGAWLLAVIVSLLVSNLLLLNQFPDVDADRQVGRRHYPILLGLGPCAIIFSVLHLVALGLLVLGVSLAWLPQHTLVALLSAGVLFKLLPGGIRQHSDSQALTPYLGLNVIFIHLYLLLLSAGLFWAAW
ncbi:1,4-dihydroxy-2-naphthoate octaprenyltransferase [Oceanisphaera marina]|uniref:1,4-dihydroxy-2-naphthoate octaprenyltransferase n=1 Tax=Oceanisphaera marina TaxID=2017550 RepID=A0ABQ1IR15_9GAMM|nr:prenyltransferase [Oceanisphaera marina]GGB50430.1 1,4-dihydroxy-2-naphthoate octaprenyltransferase [Oceanisphaera marina]